MPKGIEAIPTRQRGERLFASDTPLGSGGSVELPNADGSLVAGFNAVEIFAVSDQPFEIQVFEGCRPGGAFVVTETFASVPSGSDQVVCERVFPCGRKLRAVLNNLGSPETFLSFCATGLPEP